jgi:hypothetical protein
VTVSYKLKPQDHLVYNVVQSTEINLQGKAGEGSKTALEVSGRLHQKVYKANKEGFVFGFSITNPEVNIGLRVTEEEKKKLVKLQDDLRNEIYLKTDQLGRFLTFFSQKDMPPEAKNILKSIIVSSQTVLPDKESDRTWFKNEINMTGRYKAKYEVDDEDDDTFYIQKTKLLYTKLDSDEFEVSGANNFKILPNTKESIEFGKNGYIKRIDHYEHTLMASMGFKVEAFVATKFVFIDKTEDESIDEIPSLEAVAKKMNLSEFSVQGGEIDKAQKVKNLKKLIGGMSIRKILGVLKTLDFDKEGQKAFDMFRKIKAILKLNPEKVGELLDVAGDLDPNSPNYLSQLSIFMGALDIVEAKYAEEKLMSLIDKNLNNMPFLLQAIPAMGTLNNPTIQGKKYLTDLVEATSNYEVKSLSALSLGALSGEASTTSEKISDDAAIYLAGKLNRSTTPEERMTFTIALGNTGNVNAFEGLQKQFDTGNDDLDSTSLFALRFIPGEHIDEALVDALQNPSNNVQKKALDALSFRSPSQRKLEALADYVFDGRDENLKVSALHLISDLYPQYPDNVQEVFRDVKESNLSKKVKEAVIDLELTH